MDPSFFVLLDFLVIDLDGVREQLLVVVGNKKNCKLGARMMTSAVQIQMKRVGPLGGKLPFTDRSS